MTDEEKAKARKDRIKAKAAAAKAERAAGKVSKARVRAAFLEQGGHTEESLKAQQDYNRARWEAEKAGRKPGPRFPDTMDALRSSRSPHADIAARHTLSRLIQKWACGTPTIKGKAKGNPAEVISTAIDLYQSQLCRDAGIKASQLVGFTGGRWLQYDRPGLHDLSIECRQEALRVIAETRAEYDAAGSPDLHDPGLADRMTSPILAAVRATA